MPARWIAPLAFVVTLCAAAGAGAALDAGGSLRFGFVPQKAFVGQPASLSIFVRPASARCAGSLRYADGATQRLASIVASGGRASWRWRVPPKARVGIATRRSPAQVQVGSRERSPSQARPQRLPGS